MSVDPDSLEFHLYEILQHKGSTPTKKILEWLCPCRTDRVKDWIARIEKLKILVRPTGNKRSKKTWVGKRSNLLGRALESLVSELFLQSQVSSHKTNVITATNEIDILLTLGPLSSFVPILNGLTCVHGESKCHSRAPKTEWIAEISQNAVNAGTKLAILFVYCTPRKLDITIRTQIAITAATSATVIPFGKTQLDEIISGEPLLDVLTRQHVSARNMVSDLHV